MSGAKRYGKNTKAKTGRKKTKVKLKFSKSFIIRIIFVVIIIIIGTNIYSVAKLKNPDKSVSALLDIFYSKKSINNKTAKILLGKDDKEYIKELENETYEKTYKKLESFGAYEIIDGKDAKKISQDYAKAYTGLMKKVKKYKISDKQINGDKCKYTITIVTANLGEVYKKANDDVNAQMENIKVVNNEVTSNENYRYAIYCYYLTKAIDRMSKDSGNEESFIVTLEQNNKKQWIPNESSISTIINMSY